MLGYEQRECDYNVPQSDRNGTIILPDAILWSVLLSGAKPLHLVFCHVLFFYILISSL